RALRDVHRVRADLRHPRTRHGPRIGAGRGAHRLLLPGLPDPAGRRALRPGGPAPALRAGRGGHRGLAVRLLPDDRRRGLVAAGPRGGGRPGHPLLHVRSAGRVRLRAVPAPGALHRLLAGLHLRRADRRLDRAAAVHRPARHLPLLGSAGRLHRPHRRAQRPGPVAGPRRRPRRRRRGGARTRRDAGRPLTAPTARRPREENMRIALSQICTGPDPKANLELIRTRTAEAARAGARLAVFPEAAMACFGTPLAEVAEPLDGPWAAEVRRIAEAEGVAVVAGMSTPGEGGRVANTLLAAGPGVDAGYDKIHLYDAFGYTESSAVSAGSRPVAIDVDGVRIG